MKKIIMSVCLALIMFGLSAGASWFWHQKLLAEAAAATQTTEQHADPDDEAPAPTPATQEPPSVETRRPTHTNLKVGLHPFDQAESHISTQPAHATGLDDTVQMAASLRERMTSVRERENQLAQRQAQIELILNDIRAQRSLIEELRKQVNQEFTATEEQLAAAERKRSEIDAQQQSLQEKVTEVDGVEKEGTKRLATVYDGMAADRAAKILEHMVNSGNMDTAVKVLGGMRERQAAKVLGEFEDTSLAAQLSERLKGLKKAVSPPKSLSGL